MLSLGDGGGREVLVGVAERRLLLGRVAAAAAATVVAVHEGGGARLARLGVHLFSRQRQLRRGVVVRRV